MITTTIRYRTALLLFVCFLIFSFSCTKSVPSDSTVVYNAKSEDKKIVGITFNQFTPAIVATSDYNLGQYWRASFPAGTDLTKVIPTFAVSAKATTNPPSGVPWDVSQLTTMAVTAEDGSIAGYYFSSQPNVVTAPPVKN